MGQNSSTTSQSRISSSNHAESANGTDLTYSNYQRNFRSEPGSKKLVTTTRPAGLIPLANRPRPMVASENPVTLTDAIRKMNHHLLRSCAQLAHDAPDDALQEADYALYLAEARKVYHLQSKSQLYRGLCLMELERWEEASAAFTRAANVRGWGTRVAHLKNEAERNILEVERRRKKKEEINQH